MLFSGRRVYLWLGYGRVLEHVLVRRMHLVLQSSQVFLEVRRKLLRWMTERYCVRHKAFYERVGK